MEHLKDLITLKEASRISGYNPDYLSSLIRTGKLKGQKVGKSWLTTEDDVRALTGEASAPEGAIKLSKPFVRTLVLFTLLAILTILLGGFFAYVYQDGYEQAHTLTQNQTNASSTLDQQPTTY